MSEQEFEKAFSDSAFVEMLLGLETGEEVRKALAEKGIVLTPEELDKFAQVLLLALEKNGKLSDEDLETISGGSQNCKQYRKGAEMMAPAVIENNKVPKWAQLPYKGEDTTLQRL